MPTPQLPEISPILAGHFPAAEYFTLASTVVSAIAACAIAILAFCQLKTYRRQADIMADQKKLLEQQGGISKSIYQSTLLAEAYKKFSENDIYLAINEYFSTQQGKSNPLSQTWVMRAQNYRPSEIWVSHESIQPPNPKYVSLDAYLGDYIGWFVFLSYSIQEEMIECRKANVIFGTVFKNALNSNAVKEYLKKCDKSVQEAISFLQTKFAE